VLACIRCGEWRVLEVILGKILERTKLIDWKVPYFAHSLSLGFNPHSVHHRPVSSMNSVTDTNKRDNYYAESL